MERRAKIVGTIGPASQEAGTIEKLLQSGLNVARLNFSHGTHEEHAIVIKRLRETAASLQKPLCIMQDLQGPKIRTGDLADGYVELVPGQPFCLTMQSVPGDAHQVSVDFDDLPHSVEPGKRILLDDGNLELVVVGVKDEQIDTRVVVGGILKPHKGINLPGGRLNISAITKKDEDDLAFGLQQGVDTVALSFVRTANDVAHLRRLVNQLAPDRKYLPLVAKLERPEALNNLEEIMEVSDGVMVARGDLGVEMSPEKVPIAQKRIIECANRHGKIVITATQMLDSMIHNPRPTRAEASDVANAILDGTDAVMLSGETASGQYPVRAVQMMDAIVREAEEHMDQWGHWRGMQPDDRGDDTLYLTLAARELAHDRNVSAIAAFTKSGRTAWLMSKVRPGVPILAFSPDESTCRRMALLWGVTPHQVPHADTIEVMLSDVEKVIMATGKFRSGQQVVLVCGFPVDQVRPTNLALLHTIGSAEQA